MEHYATIQDTLKVLGDLGFTGTDKQAGFLDSPKSNVVNGVEVPVAQLRIYTCNTGYCCVEHVPGGWQAPVVWNGPKAEWDIIDTTQEFIDYLNEVAPGWR